LEISIRKWGLPITFITSHAVHDTSCRHVQTTCTLLWYNNLLLKTKPKPKQEQRKGKGQPGKKEQND
jgi:hypothetical protein